MNFTKKNLVRNSRKTQSTTEISIAGDPFDFDLTPMRVFNLNLTRLAIVLRTIWLVSLQQRNIAATHCPSAGVYVVRITRLSRS